jgi:hypothetical protein
VEFRISRAVAAVYTVRVFMSHNIHDRWTSYHTKTFFFCNLRIYAKIMDYLRLSRTPTSPIKTPSKMTDDSRTDVRSFHHDLAFVTFGFCVDKVVVPDADTEQRPTPSGEGVFYPHRRPAHFAAERNVLWIY